MKYLPKDDAYALYESILAIDPETIEVFNGERLYRSEFAEMTRTFLKTIGFNNRSIGVRTPNYSMATAIHIDVPHVNPEGLSSEEWGEAYWRQRDVCVHLERIIIAAFPKQSNYSDPQTDYFDTKFYIN